MIDIYYCKFFIIKYCGLYIVYLIYLFVYIVYIVLCDN